MVRSPLAVALFAPLLILLAGVPADACGRRHRSCCVSSCCPVPCHPYFSFHAALNKPSPYIPPDPAYRLPVKITVTNWECYGWSYYNSEYGFYLFDEWGCYVPDSFILTTELRRIDVPACASILDYPVVFLKADKLRLGRPYTVVVTLRCHASSFIVIPFVEAKGKGKDEAAAAPAPATLFVTLPPDATLMLDDTDTTSTSAERIFRTPALPPGKDFYYVLRAEVVRGGKREAVTRKVTVRAGEETRVKLDFPSADIAAR